MVRCWRTGMAAAAHFSTCVATIASALPALHSRPASSAGGAAARVLGCSLDLQRHLMHHQTLFATAVC
jgi:hypothetical protein